MKKNNILITVLIILIVILITYIAFGNNFLKPTKISPKQYQQFPPTNVQCFDHFMEIVATGYADGFNIPQFNFSDISYFRCSSQIGFDQYEVSGIDKEGNSFYIHKDEGGMAPSGADGVYNFCYKKDGVTINNDKLVRIIDSTSTNGMGVRDITVKGTCYWTDNFPLNPTSTYEFSSK